jgi:hypothetical protein
MYKAMSSMFTDLPDIGTSWWRYYVAMMRATNREIMEFADSNLIAAQIALQAAKDNPMSAVEALEVLEHNAAVMRKGTLGAQEKLLGFYQRYNPRGNGSLFQYAALARG